MKISYLLVLAGLVLMTSCGSENRPAEAADIENNEATPENPAPKGPLGTPAFESTEHDFGKIIDGEQVQHTFKFKNVGKGELTIANVQAHCGCTTPNWTREIIPPGGEGIVKATFNSTDRGEKNGVVVEKGITVDFSTSTIQSVELKLKSKIFKKE